MEILDFTLKLVNQSSKKIFEKMPLAVAVGLGVCLACEGISKIYSEYNKNLHECNLHKETMCGLKR